MQLFVSGEIWNDLRVSGIEFAWGYLLSVIVGVPFGIAIGWYKKVRLHLRPFCQRDERYAARRPFALGYYLVRYWDSL